MYNNPKPTLAGTNIEWVLLGWLNRVRQYDVKMKKKMIPFMSLVHMWDRRVLEV